MNHDWIHATCALPDPATAVPLLRLASALHGSMATFGQAGASDSDAVEARR